MSVYITFFSRMIKTITQKIYIYKKLTHYMHLNVYKLTHLMVC